MVVLDLFQCYVFETAKINLFQGGVAELGPSCQDNVTVINNSVMLCVVITPQQCKENVYHNTRIHIVKNQLGEPVVVSV